MIRFSSPLFNAWLGTSSLKTLLNGGKLYVYAGPVPANADVAVDDSATLLATVSNGGSGVTFADPANGVLKKTASESWTGAIAASGDAAFYRLCVGTDTGAAAAGAGDYRVQGTVGTDASFNLQLANVGLTAGGNLPVDDYQLVADQ